MQFHNAPSGRERDLPSAMAEGNEMDIERYRKSNEERSHIQQHFDRDFVNERVITQPLVRMQNIPCSQTQPPHMLLKCTSVFTINLLLPKYWLQPREIMKCYGLVRLASKTTLLSPQVHSGCANRKWSSETICQNPCLTS